MINTFSPVVRLNDPREEYLEIEKEYQREEKAAKLPFYLPVVQFFIGIFGSIFPGLTAKIALKLMLAPRGKAKHKVSDKTLESAKISEMLIGKNILKIYEWGAGEKTALLIHGWESRGTAMRSLVNPLVEKGFRVIAFDGPAHGNSTGKTTHIPEFSEAVAAIIRRAGNVEVVITHSFGGVCLTYASSKLMPEIILPKVVMIAVPMNFEDILKKVFTILNFPSAVKKKLNAKIVELAEETPEKISIPAKADTTTIEKLLIVHDTQDAIVNFRYAEQIKETWSNSKLIVTKGLGHYRIMKHPKVISKVMDFISLGTQKE